MPELPEVETIMQGLKPHLEGAIIKEIIIRQPKLRWPISSNLTHHLIQQPIGALSRRAKYLLMPVSSGTLIIHLGMTGSLRIIPLNTPPQKHDHVDLVLSNQQVLRYTDARRFGALLWTEEDPQLHSLLKNLGPEPLEPDFSASYLMKVSRNRRKTIKEFIMDSHVVVGVGNIYAAEALFMAQIHPTKPAGLLTHEECMRLVEAIQTVLRQAIIKGGTTIKDFINSEGKPGYFAQELQVYGRQGLPCRTCHTVLQAIKLGQRTTVFCSKCQK